MIRKWTTVLLSLFLAVMLPVCAMADTQHTLRVVPGDVLASEEAVVDLLNVLSITLTEGSTCGALSLNLNNEAIATVGLTADGTGLYVQSNLLSDDVLYVTWDDGFAVITEVMMGLLRSEGASIAELEKLESSMNELKLAIVNAVNGSSAPNLSAVNKGKLIFEAGKMAADDPKMVEFVNSVIRGITTEEGTFTSEKHDTASQKITITLTSKDLAVLAETQAARTLMEQYLRESMGSNASADKIAHYTEQNLASLKEELENSDMRLVMTVHQNADEDLPVNVTMLTTMKDGEETVALKLDYHRLSTENGVDYKAEFSMLDAEAPFLEMLFELNRGFDAVTHGRFALLADGEEITVMYKGENVEADTRSRSIDLYLRSGAVTLLEPVPSDRPIIGIELVSSVADPALLSALESADADNSVNVMKLSDEEMGKLLMDIETRCMQAVYGALGSLPTSVLTLVMGMM